MLPGCVKRPPSWGGLPFKVWWTAITTTVFSYHVLFGAVAKLFGANTSKAIWIGPE